MGELRKHPQNPAFKINEAAVDNKDVTKFESTSKESLTGRFAHTKKELCGSRIIHGPDTTTRSDVEQKDP